MDILYKIILGAICVIYSLYFVCNVMFSTTYDTLDGRTEGIVISHEDNTYYTRGGYVHDFQYTYEYEVDGKTYTNESIYVSKHIDNGSTVEVSYNTMDPSKSALKMEDEDATATIWAYVIIGLIIGGAWLYTGKNR